MWTSVATPLRGFFCGSRGYSWFPRNLALIAQEKWAIWYLGPNFWQTCTSMPAFQKNWSIRGCLSWSHFHCFACSDLVISRPKKNDGLSVGIERKCVYVVCLKHCDLILFQATVISINRTNKTKSKLVSTQLTFSRVLSCLVHSSSRHHMSRSLQISQSLLEPQRVKLEADTFRE